MKAFLSILLLFFLCAGTTSRAAAVPIVISKKQIIVFVFAEGAPFHVYSEYDRCTQIDATFRYAYHDNPPQAYPDFFPHIGPNVGRPTNEVTSPCAEADDSLGGTEASQKIADLLNSKVVTASPSGPYTLTVEADYRFEQSHSKEAIFMKENISFTFPGLEHPVTLEASTTIPKN